MSHTKTGTLDNHQEQTYLGRLLHKSTAFLIYSLWISFRILTAPWRKLPDFIVIGAQKGGTSSFYTSLCQHPDIVPAKTKEVHFFDQNYFKGLYWYRSFFPVSLFHSKKLSGEATPYYLFHPQVPARVQKHLAKVKIILLLRDPVHRAYSHYQMMRKEGLEPIATFEEAIQQEKPRLKGEIQKLKSGAGTSFNHLNYAYLSRGNYHEQINNWLKYFPQEQMLFIKSENFFANPQEELDKTCRFLGLKTFTPGAMPPQNKGYYAPINKETRQALKGYFAQENKKLAKLLGGDFSWD